MSNNTPAVGSLAETAALYAVMEGNPQKAQQLINGFSRDECATFRHQLEELHNMCELRLEPDND